MTEAVIRVENVSKTFRVYHKFGRGWLKSVLLPFLPAERFCREVPALKDIDLTIHKGEVVGIMGRNGAGKSTLLRLVSGLSLPTTGSVRIDGEIRALLTLGVGFHPRFTGRENIVFGSMAMGIPRSITKDRIDEIIDFAELGDRIDTPVQFYSSGMRSRLAAAVAFQESPDILIIDEALAAGDGYFVNKCRAQISEICRTGSTVLLVTHGVSLVERLCTRALILERGQIIADGPASETVARYRKLLLDFEEQQLRKKGHEYVREEDHSVNAVAGGRGGAAETGSPAPDTTLMSGTGAIQLLEMEMLGPGGVPMRVFGHGEPMEIRIRIRTRRPIPGQTRFYLHLFSEDAGVRIAETGSVHIAAKSGRKESLFPADLDGCYELRMTFPNNPLGGGRYFWDVFFAPPGLEMTHETAALYHLKAQRLCPFRSVSFPGENWALHRKSILEPTVDLDFGPAGEEAGRGPPGGQTG